MAGCEGLSHTTACQRCRRGGAPTKPAQALGDGKRDRQKEQEVLAGTLSFLCNSEQSVPSLQQLCQHRDMHQKHFSS